MVKHKSKPKIANTKKEVGIPKRYQKILTTCQKLHDDTLFDSRRVREDIAKLVHTYNQAILMLLKDIEEFEKKEA